MQGWTLGNGTWHGAARRVFGSLALVVGACWFAGCGPSSTNKSDAAAATDTKRAATSAANADLAAPQILERMLAAYRETPSYRDDATVTLSYRQGGKLFTDEAPIAVTLVRPNRLRLHAYQVKLACDGRTLRGAIHDASTRDIDGQFLSRPAPETLRLATLLDEPLVADQLGNALVAHDAGRLPLQLAFLLAESPISLLSDQDVEFQLLEPGTSDGRGCWRIETKTAKGKFKFWIDREDFLLRRLEYPREALVSRIADAPDVRDLQLVANFKNARFAATPDEAEFALESPPEARLVRFFVPPPQPLPTDKFGQTFDKLSLSVPDGGAVNRQSLGDRVAVLLWFSGHAECEPALRQFDQVRRKFAENDRLAFHVVATEPSSVSHLRLKELLRGWRVETPLARDLAAHGRDQLDILDTPTLVVLDGAGALQLYEVGVNPQLAEQLPQALEKLLAGEDLAAALLRQQELERQQYAKRLELASQEGPVSVVDVADVPLAPASAPKKLRLASRWRADHVKQPGNVLAIPGDSEQAAPRLLVLEERRRLVELDPTTGESLRTLELELPPETGVTQVRTFSDKSGRRYFSAWSPLQDTAYLFDGEGKRLATYPSAEVQVDGERAVRDVRLADLDANGQVEWYVAFVGAAGVHGVDLAGKRVWHSRALGAGMSLATSTPNPVGWRKLIAVGAQGQVVRFNQFGNADKAQTISGWTLVQLVGDESTATERPAPLCGLAIDRDGKYCALALDDRLVEQWNYPIPEGVWRSAVEPLQATRMLGEKRPAWLIATVDGGLHVVGDDGEFSDYWHLGELPTGLATLRLPGGAAVLIVGGEAGLQAWNVEAP